MDTKRSATLLSLVALAALPDATQQAPVEPPDELAAARARAAGLVARGAAPSVAVGVGRHGRVLWAEAFGHADIEHDIAATPSTPYPVASLTKSMTATGLMLLAAEGEVDLDAPITRYLGQDAVRDYARRAEDVSVRRVLAHEAG